MLTLWIRPASKPINKNIFKKKLNEQKENQFNLKYFYRDESIIDSKEQNCEDKHDPYRKFDSRN